MARGKYQQWLEPENLERIVNWAAKGQTYLEMAQNMGIADRTLYDWVEKHPQISQAIKKGRMLAIEVVENALFNRAVGMEVTETVEECRSELRDGKPGNGTVVKRTITRHLPPDVGAQAFILKNRRPGEYSDRKVVDMRTTAPTVVLGLTPRRADG